MKNTILSLKILHLFLLYLSLLCCAHVTAQSSPSFIEATDIFTLLNYGSDIPIFPQQFAKTHGLSQVICIGPSATNPTEDRSVPLEDIFSKLGSFLRQLGIENSDWNENIINELINKSKVYYRAYRAIELGDLDSENALLFQNQENILEDYSDHSKKMLSQVYLQLIDINDDIMEIASQIDLICVGVENMDTFPSLIIESSLQFLKRGNIILLPISTSDPASSPLDHQLIAPLSQNIHTQTVSANPNILRGNKDYMDPSVIVMDLEETELLTTENIEISSSSTPIESDLSAKPFRIRNLRRLDGTPHAQNQPANSNSNSNLTTWIVVVVVVGVILLLGVVFTVLAYLKRRNKNRQQPQSATSAAAGHPAQRVRQETTVNTVHNNRAMTAEEATLAPHSPPVVRAQQEFMNSEEDMEDPMQENFPCFNTPVRVDDVLRLFEIHFEGYKDSKGGEGHQCDICYDAKKTIMFSPCAHICACEPCAQEVMNTFGKCPLCRTQIEELTYVVKGAS